MPEGVIKVLIVKIDYLKYQFKMENINNVQIFHPIIHTHQTVWYFLKINKCQKA